MTDSPSPSDTPALTEGDDVIERLRRVSLYVQNILAIVPPGTMVRGDTMVIRDEVAAIEPELAALLARAEATEKERDEARATLKYCETCWSEERGTMIDKIQSLRSIANVNGDWTVKVSQMQARIDALTAEVARKDEALKPFTRYAEVLDESYPTPSGGEFEVTVPIAGPYNIRERAVITLADLRRARAALSPVKQEPNDAG